MTYKAPGVVTLTIIETIHYGRDFTIAELNDICVRNGVEPHDPEGETGDLKAWLADEASNALYLEGQRTSILEDIEHSSGDVQGQTWTWEY